MVPPPESVRRHFLPWTQPLLPQAVAFLTRGWNGKEALDLSSTLVVVPTSQSGRRLREALASAAAENGQAVFSPRVLTPNALLALGPDPHVASRLESLLAWAEVFRDLEIENYRDVFPIDPPGRNFNWALRLARDFSRLQRGLVEAGLRLSDVAKRAGDNFPEEARWRQIGQLEELQAKKLRDLGLRDEHQATRELVAAAALPAGIERVVVIGTPDPLPLGMAMLAGYARQVPVEAVVFAPPEEEAAFDGWGRPLASAWTNRHLDLPEFEEQVKLCVDPAEEADRVVTLVQGYRNQAGVLGVGVADGEVLPLLETRLRHEGFQVFNPGGRLRRADGLFQLLAALAALAREDSMSAVAALARCPDFLTFLGNRQGETFSAADFLRKLDELHSDFLPPNLGELRRHWPGSPELAAVAELRGLLTTGSFPENAAAALGAIFAARQFDLARPADADRVQAAEAWREVMQEMARAVVNFEQVADSDRWEVALLGYGAMERSEDKPDGAIELQGWLELLWEDAPHLVVAGLNDGIVPEAVAGDAFLPESLRERLQLKTNPERFARDAYLLQALAASRVAGGRLDLLCGKSSNAGDPLRPSRLLLRCPDPDLPRRVRFLFREVETKSENPAWRRAWRLAPRRVPPPERVSVTSLRAWLRCPFRFYLRYILRLEAVDPVKAELDAMDFGTLCHAALEDMGRDEEMRNCADAEVLRKFLLLRLEQAATLRFGRQWTLPLVVQLESARQRLSRAAEVQAGMRAEGWVIEQVELPFEIEVNGLWVRGKIDRLDRHEATGAVRVLDYKTSDRRTSPADAHLESAPRKIAMAPQFARGTVEGAEAVWQDLQLPIYLRAMAGKFPGEVSGGYFNLPKASTETGLALWEGFTPELAESAWRCAQGVAGAIRGGIFWPPNEEVPARGDEFASLFHHGVAASVDWEEAAR